MRTCFFSGTLMGTFIYAYFNITSRPHEKLAGLVLGLVWLAINGARISWLVIERSPVSLTAAEQEAYDEVFGRGSRPIQLRCFRRLAAAGEWATLPAGTVLTEEGQAVTGMTLVVRGQVRLSISGERVSMVRSGQFVGLPSLERLLHTGHGWSYGAGHAAADPCPAAGPAAGPAGEEEAGEEAGEAAGRVVLGAVDETEAGGGGSSPASGQVGDGGWVTQQLSNFGSSIAAHKGYEGVHSLRPNADSTSLCIQHEPPDEPAPDENEWEDLGGRLVNDVPTTALKARAVVVQGPARVLVWDLVALRAFLLDPLNKEAHDAFMLISNEVLLRKLLERDDTRIHSFYVEVCPQGGRMLAPKPQVGVPAREVRLLTVRLLTLCFVLCFCPVDTEAAAVPAVGLRPAATLGPHRTGGAHPPRTLPVGPRDLGAVPPQNPRPAWVEPAGFRERGLARRQREGGGGCCGGTDQLDGPAAGGRCCHYCERVVTEATDKTVVKTVYLCTDEALCPPPPPRTTYSHVHSGTHVSGATDSIRDSRPGSSAPAALAPGAGICAVFARGAGEAPPAPTSRTTWLCVRLINGFTC